MQTTALLARRLPFPALRQQLWKPSIHKLHGSASGTKASFSTSSARSVFQRYFQQHNATGLVAICIGSTAVLALVAVPVIWTQQPKLESQSFSNGTPEQRMLEISEQERRNARRVLEGLSFHHMILRSTKFYLVNYIIEPIATGIRFVTMVCIFAPLILCIPVVYFGPRVPKRSNERQGTLWWYEFLVTSLERAGPTFIKIGQWAASRTDIFPIELCDVMSELHSNAKAHSLEATKIIICKAFGGLKFEDIFEEFDETPLGVGAIAQVYRAKMKKDFMPRIENVPKNFRRNFREKIDGLVKSSPGQGVPSSYVAIKVIHPRVDKIVNRDLRIMRFFAVLLNSVPTLEWFSFPDEVDVFSNMMRLQMDLQIEAENLAKFRSNFDTRSTVTFPIPYRDYTTRDVLIEEFACGMPLSVFLENGAGVYQEDIANMGLDAFLHMLVMDNFIHSDLHPGNIMIRFLKPSEALPRPSWLPFSPEKEKLQDDNNHATTVVRSRLAPHRHDKKAWTAELTALDEAGYRPQLVFIDTGLVTELDETNRQNFLDLFRAIAEFDGYKAGQLMVERSRSPQTVLDGDVFALRMQRLVQNVKSHTLALGQISFGVILSDVLSMVRTHHVRMEGDFVNVVLSMLLLEGIGRSLDPEMDLLQSSLPMLRAVGAGTGRSLLRSGAKAQFSEGTGTMSLLKFWIALETRQLVTSSIQRVENLVKYDQLSPNF